MPTPRDDETRQEWLERCIPQVLRDGTAENQDQAVAICSQMWRDRNKVGDRAMETKSFPTFTKQIEGRTVTGFASVFGVIDGQSDITHKGAFKKTLQENMERIRHFWQHNNHEPPIAKITELREVGKTELPKDLKEKYPEATGGLLVMREYLDTPRGNEVFAALQSGAITEMSYGYDPVKFDFEELETGSKTVQVRNLRELRLWDTSDVNWGANPATMASKAAIPFKDTGAADEGESWSKPTLGDFTSDSFEDLSDGEKRRIAAHYAWSANMPPETFGDLKLPHHRASNSGVGPSVWAGVRAAMGALLGARGGVTIPSGERKSVYNHLAKHYKHWDKEPPDFKFIELATAAQEVLIIDLEGAGLLLAGKRLEEFKIALGTLNEILTAEPLDDAEASKALTEAIFTQLAIYDRELNLIKTVR